jgi:Gamma-glutamyl cyclotransferase, AIG2-like
MSPSLAIARRPLDTTTTIPASAAGRQPLFFFGTLMDLDVLAYLVERPVDLDDLRPAAISGFRRVRARDVSYPVLVPHEDGVIEGRLLRRVSARDIARINHYESGEYQAELRHVVTADGCEVAAWLFLGLDHLRASDEPWSLAEWQCRDKAAFFAACDGWMADFRRDD